MKPTPRRSAAPLVLIAALALAGAGCSYYEITDPTTGAVYYANDRKVYKGSGAVLFKDAVTGQQVTLTGSKIRKLKEQPWKAAVSAQKNP